MKGYCKVSPYFFGGRGVLGRIGEFSEVQPCGGEMISVHEGPLAFSKSQEGRAAHCLLGINPHLSSPLPQKPAPEVLMQSLNLG